MVSLSDFSTTGDQKNYFSDIKPCCQRRSFYYTVDLAHKVHYVIHPSRTGSNYAAYWDETFPYRIGTGVFIYGLIILTYYLFVSLSNLSEKNAKEARLESLVRETELKMLRSQINPHFLFNSLNSISSLTITDPEKARDMVVKLSEFMRYALSRKDELPVSLQNELDNLRLYLEIEKVRFGDKLITEETIEEECLDFKIPCPAPAAIFMRMQ